MHVRRALNHLIAQRYNNYSILPKEFRYFNTLVFRLRLKDRVGVLNVSHQIVEKHTSFVVIAVVKPNIPTVETLYSLRWNPEFPRRECLLCRSHSFMFLIAMYRLCYLVCNFMVTGFRFGAVAVSITLPGVRPARRMTVHTPL